MSLIGKIRHFFDPGYYEPEKEDIPEDSRDTVETDAMGHPFVKAPQGAGPFGEVAPGSVDSNCDDSPYVILKDVYYGMESDMLSELLDNEDIPNRIISHYVSRISAASGDEHFDRFYVAETMLDRAIELAKTAEEDSQKDFAFVENDDADNGPYDNKRSVNHDESVEETPEDAAVEDTENVYLIGTDFVLIRQYDNPADKVDFIRVLKEEGIPYTVTDQYDEPDSEPFRGERVYVTDEYKKKALRLARELELAAEDDSDGAVL